MLNIAGVRNDISYLDISSEEKLSVAKSPAMQISDECLEMVMAAKNKQKESYELSSPSASDKNRDI